MRITRLGGVTWTNDTTLYAPDKVECLFQAQAAFDPGMCVAHTGLASVNTTGILVVKTPASATADHLLVGIFEGLGAPSGADAAVTGASGKSAQAGDVILVTAYGRALAQINATVTTMNALDVMAPSLATAGLLIDSGTAMPAGLFAPLVALDSLDPTTTATIKAVFVKCL